MSSPFNLETALSTWRHYFAQRHGFLKEDLDELERHVRDYVKHAVGQGTPEEEAFWEAVREMGDYEGAEEEYRKVYWGKLRRVHRLSMELGSRLSMWKNYLKIAFRNLRRQPGYSLINIGGLALGLACSLLILLVVQHELSFDRFHKKGDRIYRLIPSDSAGASVVTPAGLAPDLQARFPEIQRFVRVDGLRSPYVKINDENRIVQGFALVEPDFFQVFSFKLLRGSPNEVLDDPHSVVLTETTAHELFGDKDPIGRTLILNDSNEFTVTGLMADVPSNSHLQFNMLGSIKVGPPFFGKNALQNYTNWNYTTYLLLAPNTSATQLEAKLTGFLREKLGDDPDLIRLELQPLKDIHFTTNIQFDVDTNRDIRYVYAFSAIAIFILLIACINFMNLSTARAAKRAKEVGVRKVAGAGRMQLVGQFLSESVLLSVLALVLAIVLVVVFLPLFNSVIGAAAHLDAGSFGTVAILAGVGLLVGALAGSYPAFYLSAFQPARVLKGEAARGRGAASLRKGLIVLQFGISVFLIVCTVTVYDQLQFMRHQALGFNKEQVVFFSPAPPLRQNYEAFKHNLLQDPHIRSVAMAGQVPGRVETTRGYNWPGQQGADESGDSFYTILADPEYVETMGLDLIAGRNFSWEVVSDTEDTYILNETAVKKLGWKNPVGHAFRAWDRPMGKVIGVVKDFHFKSLQQAIEPVVINYKPGWFKYVVVRLAPGDVAGGMDALQSQWKALAPGFAFDYTFLDDDFDRLYKAEEQLAERFALFASIALFVACLGLFGLASYSAEQRTKEIGIRKVLGASAPSIVTLLSKDFLVLVLIAFGIAVPVAYYLMSRWLQDFAYRIDLGLGVFLLAGALALLIALATISYQAVKAALADPVKSLRYE